jgi:hypothetical protein
VEPIVDSGWFMAWDGRVAFTYMDERVTEASFGRYLTALARDIDQAAPSQRRGVLYDTPTPGSATAPRRRLLGEILDQRKEKLREITAGYVMVTPSTVVRGVLTAVFWLAPPPYENKVVATTNEGFRWLAERCPWLDAAQSESRYARLRAELLARMPSA